METTSPTYFYRAAAADGRLERGTLEAPTRDAALKVLLARGLQPVQLGVAPHRTPHRPRVSSADLALTLRVMSELIGSGLTIDRVLTTLESLAPPRLAIHLPEIRQSVREGKSLSRALAEARIAIPPVVLGVIRAGERGTGMAAAVGQAAELCESAAATRAAVRSALAYPAMLAVFGSAVVVLLAEVMLPRFAAMLGDMGQTLPTTTRIVLEGSALVRVSLLPGLFVLMLAAVAWRSWTSTETGRANCHELLLGLPMLGETRMAAASARTCATLAALLENGVPIAHAIGQTAQACGDAAVGMRLRAAQQRVEHGERLSNALSAEGAASSVVRQLVRAGEESGRLASMLVHASRIESDRATRRINSAVRLLEPLFIIGFGGLVALVAAALLQALYSVRPGT